MITTINYVLPMLGLCICLFVVMTHRIDTRCPIRMAKMVLWINVWMLVLYFDHPRIGQPELSITVARALLIVINILYIVETLIYPCRKRKTRKCKGAEAIKRAATNYRKRQKGEKND